MDFIFIGRSSVRERNFLWQGDGCCLKSANDQGADVSGLLLENGFTEVKVIRDLAGLDRVVIGKYEE